MLRNTKNNLIYFRFPNDFVPKIIDDKYSILLKQYQAPFKSVIEFLNSLVISINFPSLSLETTQQEHGRAPRNYRGGLDVYRAIDKNISIDLRLTEGYLSYFMMYDLFIYWNNNMDANNRYLSPFVFKTLDLRGREMATIKYNEVLYTELGELSLSFSDVDPSFNTFSVGFLSNMIDIQPLAHLTKT
jgi:hypothetical protein